MGIKITSKILAKLQFSSTFSFYFNPLDSAPNFSLKLWYTCCKHHWPLPLFGGVVVFSGFDHGLGSQSHQKANYLCSILIHMSNMWIKGISWSGRCPSIYLSVLHNTSCNFGCYVQTFLPVSFIPATLTDSIDLCPSLSFSVTLTLARGLKMSTKQTLLTSCTLFNWLGWNVMMAWSGFVKCHYITFYWFV